MINSFQQLVRMNYIYFILEVVIFGEDVEYFLGFYFVLSDDGVELDYDFGYIFVFGDDFVQWFDYGVGYYFGFFFLVSC